MPSKLNPSAPEPVNLLDSHIDDPSTRSESSPSKSESAESFFSSSSSATSEGTSKSSIYKSANETPSIDPSKSNESFYSGSHSQEESQQDGGLTSDESANQYLDEGDLVTAKKLLGKLCKTMVESTCHHGKKSQQLNANLDKLQKALDDNVSVLNDFVVDFDLKSADKVGAMVERIDPEMTALEEIARFSSALTSLEEWLDLTGEENQRDLDTIERAKQNLEKQKELENQVKHLEEQSFKHRALFNALEMNDPVLLDQAVAAAAAKKSSVEKKRYGVKENKHFIPEFLDYIKDFEANLSDMKRFFLPAGLLPRNYFDKMETVLENIKNETSKQPLSAASSMTSLFSTMSENPIAYSTCDYHFAPSSEDDELEIEVSRSDTSYSNSEASLALSNESIESTQSSCYDTVESTQASSSPCNTLASTQASSNDTVDATQQSVSNESIGESSVSTCPSFELECDITQKSDASLETAISPRSSSLKTALSCHDVVSSDSMGSSSTIAI